MVRRLIEAPDLRGKIVSRLVQAPDLTGLKEVPEKKVDNTDLSGLVSDILKARKSLDRHSLDLIDLRLHIEELQNKVEKLDTTDPQVQVLRDRLEVLNTQLVRVTGVKHKQNTDTSLGVQEKDLDMGGRHVVNLGEPVNENDIVNKKYVDARERIVYQGGGGGANKITDLLDIKIASVADDQVLQYDSATKKWKNTDILKSEPPSSAFKKITNIYVEPISGNLVAIYEE